MERRETTTIFSHIETGAAFVNTSQDIRRLERLSQWDGRNLAEGFLTPSILVKWSEGSVAIKGDDQVHEDEARLCRTTTTHKTQLQMNFKPMFITIHSRHSPQIDPRPRDPRDLVAVL